MDSSSEPQNQNQNQNQQNPSQVERPYQDNADVYDKNQKINSNNNPNNNQSNEIELLKKEIFELKNLHNIDEQKINNLSNTFQNEIKLLKEQINNLTNELNELKNKKNKKESNNINNINNDNYNGNDSDSNEDMDENPKYSIQCLSHRLNIEILQGTERADIDIIIKNNSFAKFPQKSYLICDNKNSLLLCERVKLNELEPNQQQKVDIVFNNLKFISKGKYRCIVKLEVDNKVYNNSAFEIIVNVLENQVQNFQQPNFQSNFVYPQGLMPGENFGNFNQGQNMNMNFGGDIDQMVINFRNQFCIFNDDNMTDEKLKEVLRANNFDFNKAFESLFN